MPKATKLHPKGKTSTIQKPCKKEKDGTDNVDPEESMRQFQLELCWCIQQCERFLSEKKGSEKQMQETWKVLAVLKNNNQPMIRKRQLMRSHLGDYRSKMALEEKKLAKYSFKNKDKEAYVKNKVFGRFKLLINQKTTLSDTRQPSNSIYSKSYILNATLDHTLVLRGDPHHIQETADSEYNLYIVASKMKISETPDKPKATFVRKSAFLTTGDNSFRFNFNLAPQDIDDPNTSSASDDKPIADGNTHNLEVLSENIGNSNTLHTDQKLVDSTVNTENKNGNTEKKQDENTSKNFKFSFSESQFKFNFNVNP